MTVEGRADPAAYLAQALGDVCFGDEETFPLERTDGELVDRAGFIAHIKAVRGSVLQGQVEVQEVVRDGTRIADRHRVMVTKRDGTVSVLEVYLFGEIADDGGLRRVDEISHVVSGSDDDGQLARTR
jgi:hypothetical protein